MIAKRFWIEKPFSNAAVSEDIIFMAQVLLMFCAEGRFACPSCLKIREIFRSNFSACHWRKNDAQEQLQTKKHIGDHHYFNICAAILNSRHMCCCRRYVTGHHRKKRSNPHGWNAGISVQRKRIISGRASDHGFLRESGIQSR
jgi:hypothetical protein